MKLSEVMKEKIFYPSDCFHQKQTKVWKIFRARLNICANTNRNIFPILMELVEQMLVRTWMCAR